MLAGRHERRAGVRRVSDRRRRRLDHDEQQVPVTRQRRRPLSSPYTRLHDAHLRTTFTSTVLYSETDVDQLFLIRPSTTDQMLDPIQPAMYPSYFDPT